MKVLFSVVFVVLTSFSGAVLSNALVKTIPAKSLIMYPTNSAPATVVALNQSKIPSELSAKVTSIDVGVGSKITKGQVIATLDCSNYQHSLSAENARLQQLQVQYQFEQRELDRGRVLAQQKNIGDAELDRRETSFNTSQALLLGQRASVQMAKLNVARCSVTAPFNGTVIKKYVNQGEMMSPGMAIVELLADAQLEVSAKVSAQDQLSFSNTDNYLLTVDNQEFAITRQAFLPLIETNARAREARFTFVKQQALAGSIGRVSWQSPQAHLPAHLLQKRQRHSGFFVAENGKAKFVVVANAEEGRPIPFDFDENLAVIIEGRYGLVDGDAITVVSGDN